VTSAPPVQPLFTVVIPTLGRPCLISALRSLVAVEDFDALAVLVCGAVTAEPECSSFQRLRQEHPNIQNPPASLGLKALHEKRNLGWQLARTELVAYLDDDVTLEPAWAHKIREPFSDPQVGLVSGPGLIPDQLPLMARLAGLALSSGAAGYVAERYRLGAAAVHEIKWSKIIGCNMAVRRRLLEACGGFNPVFEAGDEMFVSHAITRSGYHVMFASDARAYHFPRATLPGFIRQIHGYGATRIRLIRHGVEVEWTTLLPAALVGSAGVLALLAALLPMARWLLGLELAAYAIAVVLIVVRILCRTRQTRDLLLLALIPLMHAVYGAAEWQEVFLPRRRPL
jgi:hypothetical protein